MKYMNSSTIFHTRQFHVRRTWNWSVCYTDPIMFATSHLVAKSRSSHNSHVNAMYLVHGQYRMCQAWMSEAYFIWTSWFHHLIGSKFWTLICPKCAALVISLRADTFNTSFIYFCVIQHFLPHWNEINFFLLLKLSFLEIIPLEKKDNAPYSWCNRIGIISEDLQRLDQYWRPVLYSDKIEIW